MPIALNPKASNLKYHVDLVMCIDATGSMSHIIEEVKSNALSFYNKFVDAMEVEKKKVQGLRIKVIAFRDFSVDSQPMIDSGFFIMGGGQIEQAADLRSFMEGIKAQGGGDAPENSLEALALAFKSDWVHTTGVRRHVTMLFTDATAVELGSDRENANYPADMPSSLAHLREFWESQYMEARAKRLLLFTPESEPWTTIAADWTNSLHMPSKAGMGLCELDMSSCIHMLVKSI